MMRACSSSVACTGYFRLVGSSLSPRIIAIGNMPAVSRRGLRFEHTDYAMFNDEAHRWQGVFYYISRDAQVWQLEPCGFEFLEALAEDGHTLRFGEPTEHNGSIHYVCRKR